MILNPCLSIPSMSMSKLKNSRKGESVHHIAKVGEEVLGDDGEGIFSESFGDLRRRTRERNKEKMK